MENETVGGEGGRDAEEARKSLLEDLRLRASRGDTTDEMMRALTRELLGPQDTAPTLKMFEVQTLADVFGVLDELDPVRWPDFVGALSEWVMTIAFAKRQIDLVGVPVSVQGGGMSYWDDGLWHEAGIEAHDVDAQGRRDDGQKLSKSDEVLTEIMVACVTSGRLLARTVLKHNSTRAARDALIGGDVASD